MRGRLFALLGLAACAAPADVFERAQRALAKQDLPGALVAFDAVPVSHARYPEARAAALGIERRMRRGHELVLEGMLLRSEWRDDEALVALERAREVWPGMPDIPALVGATRHRQEALAQAGPSDPAAPAVVSTEPAPAVPVPAAPAGEMAAPHVEVALPPSTGGEPSPAAPVPDAADVDASNPPDLAEADPVALPPDLNSPVVKGLVGVEARLGRGELEGALADLLELAKQHPDDARVRMRLARVLHQRALQHYAQGQVTAAISDWERVLAIEPRNRLAQDLMFAARAEIGAVGPAR